MKKGFFFSMDAFFAILTFTIILVSIYGYFVNVHELRQQYFYSEDILDVFSNIKMEELDLENYYNLNLLNTWELIDNELTIMEQMVTFSNKGYFNYSQWIFYNLTSVLLDERYGSSFNIGRNEIFGTEKNITASVARQRFVSGVN